MKRETNMALYPVFLKLEGRKVLTAYAPVAPLGWLMFVELPAEEAYAPLYAALKRLAFVLLGALGFAVLAGMFLAASTCRVPVVTKEPYAYGEEEEVPVVH